MTGDATMSGATLTLASNSVSNVQLDDDAVTSAELGAVTLVDGGLAQDPSGALKLNITKKEFLGSAGADSTLSKNTGTTDTTLFDNGDLGASSLGATAYHQVYINGILQRGRVLSTGVAFANSDGEDLDTGVVDYVWDADSELLHFIRTDIVATDDILVFFAG